MTPATCIFHQAAEIGLRPMEFVDMIIQMGLEKHGTKFNMQQNRIAPVNKKQKLTAPSNV